MAAFSYQQHHLFLLDQTVCFPNPTTTTTTSTTTSFPQFYQHHDQVFVTNNLQTLDSSMSMVLQDQKILSGNELLVKKRKDKQMCSVNHAQSKGTTNRLKKQKKNNDCQEVNKKKNITKQVEEVGYVHVRARRGEATDSHSLAERARREKISEKMKLLQAIVPGCDKVTGKALMLDEIINYVRFLKNQVEVLSMKLASVNPTFYDFGADLDAFMLIPDENMSSMLEQCSPNGGASAAAFAPGTHNYSDHLPQLFDGSAPPNSLMFQQSQLPNILSQ